MKIEKYLEQSPLFALNACYQSVIPKLNVRLKAERLNLLQALVLTALLFEEDAEVSPSSLAKVFRSSRGNISHILSELEYRGFIRRVVKRTDARGFDIEIKPEGRKKAVALVKFFDQIQASFENKLGIQNCQRTVDGMYAFAKVFKSTCLKVVIERN